MLPEAVRTLLIVDADPAQHRRIAPVCTRLGWRLQAEAGAVAASVVASDVEKEIAAVMLCGWHPSHAPLIGLLKAQRPGLSVLVCADGAVSVEAMRAGASDFLTLPVAADRLIAALAAAGDRRRRNSELRPYSEKLSKPLGLDEIIGSTSEFSSALALAAKAARSRVPVLIQGERGSGRETFARAIHAASPRAAKPFLCLDCSSLTSGAAESTLFGHEKGAFPGAFDRHSGLLEQADGSTLFLDEVDFLPWGVQVRLLDVLESGEVQRLGGQGFKAVDVRVIAAATRPLKRLVELGEFREDLYWRLNMVGISIPPLRERRPDIPSLARHLLARIAEQPGMRPLTISDDALRVLSSYGWPGNVRQLQSVLFRAAVGAAGQTLAAEDFPRVALESAFSRRADDYPAPRHEAEAGDAAAAGAQGITLYGPDGHLRTLDAIEADVIRLAISRYRGRMTEVARRLGIGRSTLYRKLAELGISDAA